MIAIPPREDGMIHVNGRDVAIRVKEVIGVKGVFRKDILVAVL